MNSRVLWAIIISIFGIVLIIPGLIFRGSIFFLFYYGIILLIIGIIVFFNNKEDKIEQIKSRR